MPLLQTHTHTRVGSQEGREAHLLLLKFPQTKEISGTLKERTWTRIGVNNPLLDSESGVTEWQSVGVLTSAGDGVGCQLAVWVWSHWRLWKRVKLISIIDQIKAAIAWQRQASGHSPSKRSCRSRLKQCSMESIQKLVFCCCAHSFQASDVRMFVVSIYSGLEMYLDT